MQNSSDLKIGYYNTVYCTEGRTLGGFIRTHYHHYLGRHANLLDLADPQRAMDFVDSDDFDIVVLSEILGSRQRVKLSALLDQRGFETFYGQGHGLAGLPGDHVEILLATRRKAEEISIPKLDVPPSMGHGGGIVAVNLNDVNCDIYAVHLALAKHRNSLERQIRAIINSRKERNSKDLGVITGDFNVSPERIMAYYSELVADHELVSLNEPTCSTVWPISMFYSECIDQVWSRGFKAKNKKLFTGSSDHRGVIVELRIDK